MEKRIIAVFENRIAKILNFGPDRIFVRIVKDGQIRGSTFEEATKFSSVQEAIDALCIGIKKEPVGVDLFLPDFRLGLLMKDGRTVDWLTRENHPVAFAFMNRTASLRWTFECNDGEFKNEYLARFSFYGKIPEIASIPFLKESLERTTHIEVTKLEILYDFTKPEVTVNLKWKERN